LKPQPEFVLTIDKDQFGTPERNLRCQEDSSGARQMDDPNRLRELASWYRKFAERTANPMIWECRLRTADDLDEEAARLERLGAVHDSIVVSSETDE
jgi:hypothetical protein